MGQRLFVYILVFSTVLTVQLVYARELAVLSSPLPVIEGRINGMDVVVQGDSVAYFADDVLGAHTEESCSKDLNCTLHRHHVKVVQISPGAVQMLQLNPEYREHNNQNNSTSSLLPPQTLNTPESSCSARVVEHYIPIEQTAPASTVAGLYTGEPVADLTPALVWINRNTITLLADIIETVSILPTPDCSAEDDITRINPSPTNSPKVLTTMADDTDELVRQLISSATTPVLVPTPTRTAIDDSGQEVKAIWLDMESGWLQIKPGTNGQYDSRSVSKHSFTFTTKQVPVASESQDASHTDGLPQPSQLPASSSADSAPAQYAAGRGCKRKSRSQPEPIKRARQNHETPASSEIYRPVPGVNQLQMSRVLGELAHIRQKRLATELKAALETADTLQAELSSVRDQLSASEALRLAEKKITSAIETDVNKLRKIGSSLKRKFREYRRRNKYHRKLIRVLKLEKALQKKETLAARQELARLRQGLSTEVNEADIESQPSPSGDLSTDGQQSDSPVLTAGQLDTFRQQPLRRSQRLAGRVPAHRETPEASAEPESIRDDTPEASAEPESIRDDTPEAEPDEDEIVIDFETAFSHNSLDPEKVVDELCLWETRIPPLPELSEQPEEWTPELVRYLAYQWLGRSDMLDLDSIRLLSPHEEQYYKAIQNYVNQAGSAARGVVRTLNDRSIPVPQHGVFTSTQCWSNGHIHYLLWLQESRLFRDRSKMKTITYMLSVLSVQAPGYFDLVNQYLMLNLERTARSARIINLKDEKLYRKLRSVSHRMRINNFHILPQLQAPPYVFSDWSIPAVCQFMELKNNVRFIGKQLIYRGIPACLSQERCRANYIALLKKLYKGNGFKYTKMAYRHKTENTMIEFEPVAGLDLSTYSGPTYFLAYAEAVGLTDEMLAAATRGTLRQAITRITQPDRHPALYEGLLKSYIKTFPSPEHAKRSIHRFDTSKLLNNQKWPLSRITEYWESPEKAGNDTRQNH